MSALHRPGRKHSGTDLSRREADLQELMDDPDCDPIGLRNTYAQFRYVNRLVGGWHRVYRHRIRPLLDKDRVTTLLDVGCGGGDVPRALSRWAARDGLSLRITGIDPDERALAFAATRAAVAGVSFRRATTADLVREGATFDLVVSNHVLHHLTARELDRLLVDSARLSTRLVVHSDIARKRLAYSAYAVVSRPFGHRSFIHVDGLRSIRRSYTVEELAARVPEPWTVAAQSPARLLLLNEVLPSRRRGPANLSGASGSIQP